MSIEGRIFSMIRMSEEGGGVEADYHIVLFLFIQEFGDIQRDD